MVYKKLLIKEGYRYKQLDLGIGSTQISKD